MAFSSAVVTPYTWKESTVNALCVVLAIDDVLEDETAAVFATSSAIAITTAASAGNT